MRPFQNPSVMSYLAALGCGGFSARSISQRRDSSRFTARFTARFLSIRPATAPPVPGMDASLTALRNAGNVNKLHIAVALIAVLVVEMICT